jgi:type I site-specific restriction endonuclease
LMPSRLPLRTADAFGVANHNPEQKARDNIDQTLEEAGWKVQPRKALDVNAGQGIAVREYDSRPTKRNL